MVIKFFSDEFTSLFGLQNQIIWNSLPTSLKHCYAVSSWEKGKYVFLEGMSQDRQSICEEYALPAVIQGMMVLPGLQLKQTAIYIGQHRYRKMLVKDDHFSDISKGIISFCVAERSSKYS